MSEQVRQKEIKDKTDAAVKLKMNTLNSGNIYSGSAPSTGQSISPIPHIIAKVGKELRYYKDFGLVDKPVEPDGDK